MKKHIIWCLVISVTVWATGCVGDDAPKTSYPETGVQTDFAKAADTCEVTGCPEGLTCQDGICVSPPPVVEPLQGSVQPSGDGQPPPFTEKNECAEHYECYASLNCVNGHCLACSDTTPCVASDKECVNGKCLPKVKTQTLGTLAGVFSGGTFYKMGDGQDSFTYTEIGDIMFWAQKVVDCNDFKDALDTIKQILISYGTGITRCDRMYGYILLDTVLNLSASSGCVQDDIHKNIKDERDFQFGQIYDAYKDINVLTEPCSAYSGNVQSINVGDQSIAIADIDAEMFQLHKKFVYYTILKLNPNNNVEFGKLGTKMLGLTKNQMTITDNSYDSSDMALAIYKDDPKSFGPAILFWAFDFIKAESGGLFNTKYDNNFYSICTSPDIDWNGLSWLSAIGLWSCNPNATNVTWNSVCGLQPMPVPTAETSLKNFVDKLNKISGSCP